MIKAAKCLLWIGILAALALPAFAETRSIFWDPVTTYSDGTPIEAGKTITYSVYWTTDPGLSLASLHMIGTSLSTTSTTFDPDVQGMTRGGTVYFTGKAVLNTGEESALSPAFAWVVPPATPSGSLSVAAAGGLSSSGTAGGPFSPSALSYTLTNPGGTAITWTAAKTQTWVTLSSAGGTLAAGGTATVTVTINSGANSLAAGSYSDTVTLTNTTNGAGNTTRGVSLTVNATSGSLSVAGGRWPVLLGDRGRSVQPVGLVVHADEPRRHGDQLDGGEDADVGDLVVGRRHAGGGGHRDGDGDDQLRREQPGRRQLQRHGDADEHHQRGREHDAGGEPDGERDVRFPVGRRAPGACPPRGPRAVRSARRPCRTR